MASIIGDELIINKDINSGKNSFNGIISLPGDKSIAHRALLHASLAMGDSRISNLPRSKDIQSTISALQTLKVPIIKSFEDEITIMGGGGEYAEPDSAIDCGNSGTTMRLMMGLLAASPFETKLIGDESLSKRPMERVAEPLRKMGAQIETSNGKPPVKIIGQSPLQTIEYKLPVASAQLKSALIYASMFANGESIIIEPVISRDHTELALECLCSGNYHREITDEGTRHFIKGGFEISSFDTNIPGDPSSAAYFVALALLMPDSEVTFAGLCLNPRRIRYLEILRMMGGDIEITPKKKELGEEVGDVIVRSSELSNLEIDPRDVPLIIDEIPLLAVIASKANGELVVRGADELRFKESDRISAIAGNLKAAGCDIDEYPDGFRIGGMKKVNSFSMNHYHDHRILMSLIVFALIHNLEIDVDDLSLLDVSFPEFMDYINLFRTKM